MTTVWVLLLAGLSALSDGQLTMGSLVAASPTTYASEADCKTAAGDKDGMRNLYAGANPPKEGAEQVVMMCLPAGVLQVREKN